MKMLQKGKIIFSVAVCGSQTSLLKFPIIFTRGRWNGEEEGKWWKTDILGVKFWSVKLFHEVSFSLRVLFLTHECAHAQ